MIKKIKIEQLRPGIFVHDFNCDWAGENVFINKALIKSEKAIEIIGSWGIKEIYIDTERGLDVKRGKTSSEVRQKTDSNLHKLALNKKATLSPSVPLKEEARMVMTIKKEAVDTMQRTMNSVQEGKHVDVESAFQLVEKMEASVTRNKDALVMLTRIRKKDEYTLMHSISVTSLVLAFCNYCGISSHTTINMATGALLHDIGKLQIPLNILNKPAKLDSKEFAIMKKHSEYSAQILADTKGLPAEAFDIALHHHERFDGTGYPNGLKGDAIDFSSKVASICDVYDAITSERCYKRGLERVEGLRKIYEWSEYHFDKELAYKFISCIGVYPIGTCVRLENQLTGIVIGSTENVLQPVVRLFFDNKTGASIQIREIDLSRADVNIISYDSPENWNSEKMQIFKQCRNLLSPFH